MPDSLNNKVKHQWRFKAVSKEILLRGIAVGDTQILARAISMVEGTIQSNRHLIGEILQHLSSDWITNDTLRIGITGPPGVGKSTFIEQIGSHLATANAKLAVLPIDPSSGESKGSILGDKTRMQHLSQNENVYIRPNPSQMHLGGLTLSTSPTILLCEAAGYKTILLESVGVGQSEVQIQTLTDLTILLIQPGAGDEIQGIKKGVLEIADILIVNKADGDQYALARKKCAQLKQLYPDKPVLLHSANDGELTQQVIKSIKAYHPNKNRSNQLKALIAAELQDVILSKFKNDEKYHSLLQNISNNPLVASKYFGEYMNEKD